MNTTEQDYENMVKTVSGRNAAIELYRVLLMFLIVLHHADVHGYWKDDATYLSMPILFSLCTCWHVDGFLSITGWFGTSFTLIRYLKVWGVVAFYTGVSILCRYICTGVVSPVLAGGWFVGAFMFFLLISPMLNLVVNAIKDRKLIHVWLLFDVAVLLTWLPFNFFSFVSVGSRDGAGYGVLTFVIVYVNVRLIRLFEIDNIISRYHIIVGGLSFIIGVLVFSVVPAVLKIYHGSVVSHMGLVGRSTYDAPYVVTMAIVMLVLFAKYVRVPERFSKLVLTLSPTMFGVYVLHDTTWFGHYLFLILPQKYMSCHLSLHPVLIVFISALCCFALCIAIDFVRRYVAMCLLCHVMQRINTISWTKFDRFIIREEGSAQCRSPLKSVEARGTK